MALNLQLHQAFDESMSPPLTSPHQSTLQDTRRSKLSYLDYPQLSPHEIEQLVPWRYLSKDYFLRRAPPLSPSSLAPKAQALSTQTHFFNKTQLMKRITQQQRLFLRDNP